MGEKSHVSLTVCPICEKENGALILDKRLRPKFERHTVDPSSPCDACREKYLTEGILMINPQTLALAVIKEAAFRRAFPTIKVPTDRVAFADHDLIVKIIKESEYEQPLIDK